MREIIFRGKRSDTGEWIEGYYCRAFRWEGDKNPVPAIQEADCYLFREIIPETVGQYTGLTNKDGRKIFEGDIVTYKIPFTDKAVKTETGTVIYEGCGFHIKEDGCMLCVADEECEIQVIGNIYDNDESAQSAEPSTQADSWLMSRFQKQE